MELQRKKILKLSGTAFISLSGISALTIPGYSGIQRKNIKESEADTDITVRLGHERSMILYYASLAPSPHNTQL
jgi:hypothetical protein